MKKTSIIYWIFTGLFGAFMLLSSIPNIMSSPESVAFMSHLGYPPYIIPFLGVVKMLGVIGIVIPGYPRIKEWAYAGFFFDLTGAVYSMIAVDGFVPQISFMILPFVLVIGSYIYCHKKAKEVFLTPAFN